MSNHPVGPVVVRPVLISTLPSMLHKIISSLVYWLLGWLKVARNYSYVASTTAINNAAAIKLVMR